MRKFYFIYIFIILIVFSYNLNIVSANSDLVDCRTLKKATPEDCPDDFVSMTKLVGTLDFIMDKGELIHYSKFRYEIYFKPDKNQNHEYIYLYNVQVDEDDSRPYLLSPRLKNFAAPSGSRVMITITRTQKFAKDSYFGCDSCHKTDVVTAIKLL